MGLAVGSLLVGGVRRGLLAANADGRWSSASSH